MIAPPGVGVRPHRIWLQAPGPMVPTDDGGYEQSWVDLAPPRAYAKISTATAVDMQQMFADSTTLSTASHVINLPHHPGITTKVRILFDGRTFMVTGVADPDSRKAETVLACTEVVL